MLAVQMYSYKAHTMRSIVVFQLIALVWLSACSTPARAQTCADTAEAERAYAVRLGYATSSECRDVLTDDSLQLCGFEGVSGSDCYDQDDCLTETARDNIMSAPAECDAAPAAQKCCVKLSYNTFCTPDGTVCFSRVFGCVPKCSL